MSKLRDLTGQKFGKLIVLYRNTNIYPNKKKAKIVINHK